MTDSKLRFDGPLPTLFPGGAATIPVSNVEPDTYTSVRLELRLQESKKRLSDKGGTESWVAATGNVPLGSRSVELVVPSNLPQAYRGKLIGWDFQLHLIGSKAGRDHTATKRVVIGPQIDPPEHDRRVTGRSSRPLQLSNLLRPPGNNQRGHLAAGALLGLLAIGLLIAGLLALRARESGDGSSAGPALIIVAIGCGTWAVYELWKVRFSKANKLNGSSFHISAPTAKPGGEFIVSIDTGGQPDLEIGLVFYELVVTREVNGTGSRSLAKTTVSHIVRERLQPAVDGDVILATRADDPPTYAGSEIALQCLVVLRSSKFKVGAGRRRVAIEY